MCGASQGIGEAAAIELAQLGARIVLISRSLEKLEKVRVKLPRSQEHVCIAVDLAEYDTLPKILESHLKDFPPIAILVNNAGGPPAGPLMDVKADQFEKALRSHVCAAQVLAQYLLPQMKKEGFGRIINIISTSVKVPIPNLGLSNTIRGAMASWSKTLSNEVGSFGVTVNNILPGFTKTPRLEALVATAAKNQNHSTSEIEKMWQNTIPARRFAEPQEIAEAIAFLASPSAAYINGTSLPVDGGRTPSL